MTSIGWTVFDPEDSVGREKLKQLAGKVKIKRPDPPNTGVIMNGYAERDGKHLRVYTRSPVLAHQLPKWLAKELTHTTDDGEESLTVNGLWAVQQYYPGVETVEIFGSADDLEVTVNDKMYREAAENPQIQEIMQVLGGTLISVKPLKKKRGKRAKTD
jgi:hypothetical protein